MIRIKLITKTRYEPFKLIWYEKIGIKIFKIGIIITSVFNSIEEMQLDEMVWNVGGGARYLISPSLEVKVGGGIAIDPEDWAFYIVVGTSWLK